MGAAGLQVIGLDESTVVEAPEFRIPEATQAFLVTFHVIAERLTESGGEISGEILLTSLGVNVVQSSVRVGLRKSSPVRVFPPFFTYSLTDRASNTLNFLIRDQGSTLDLKDISLSFAPSLNSSVLSADIAEIHPGQFRVKLLGVHDAPQPTDGDLTFVISSDEMVLTELAIPVHLSNDNGTHSK